MVMGFHMKLTIGVFKVHWPGVRDVVVGGDVVYFSVWRESIL